MELVKQVDGDYYTNSSLIGRKFGIKHNKIVRTIKKLCSDLKHIGSDIPLPVCETKMYRNIKYRNYKIGSEFFSILVSRFNTEEALKLQAEISSAMVENRYNEFFAEYSKEHTHTHTELVEQARL